MIIIPTLGTIIKEYRLQHNMSQRAFARVANLSNAEISNIERASNSQGSTGTGPDIITYNKVARAMGISIQQLSGMLDFNLTIPEVPLDTTPVIENTGNATDEIIDRLNAFQQNPKLTTLFDKARNMVEEDIDLILQIIDRING